MKAKERVWLLLLSGISLAFAQEPASETGSITGRILAPNGSDPVPNAQVVLRRESDTGIRGENRKVIRSAADGGFRFDNVPTGRYAISAVAGVLSGGPALTVPVPECPIEVKSGGQPAQYDVAMHVSFASLRVRVTSVADGKPVAGARVTLFSFRNGNVSSSRVLTANGAGHFAQVVAPGVYQLSAAVPGFESIHTERLTMEAGQPRERIELRLTPKVSSTEQSAAVFPATPTRGQRTRTASDSNDQPGVPAKQVRFFIEPEACPEVKSRITGSASVRSSMSISESGAKTPGFVRFLITEDISGTASDVSGNKYAVTAHSSFEFEGERGPSPLTETTELNGKQTLELTPAADSKDPFQYSLAMTLKGALSPQGHVPVIAATHPAGCFPFATLAGSPGAK